MLFKDFLGDLIYKKGWFNNSLAFFLYFGSYYKQHSRNPLKLSEIFNGIGGGHFLDEIENNAYNGLSKCPQGGRAVNISNITHPKLQISEYLPDSY